MRALLLAALATVGSVGCIGGIDEGTPPFEPPPGGPNTTNPTDSDLTAAKQLFDQNVFGIVETKCSGGACHSETATGTTLTRFVATDAVNGWVVATGYQALVGSFLTTAAPILTKITAGHQAITYSADESTKITDWLNKELELRNDQPQTTPPPGGETIQQAAERVLSEFAGCVTKANFDAANMAQDWGRMQANNGSTCESCHANGQSYFLANSAGSLMFDVVMSKKYFFLQYLTLDLTAGAVGAKVIINEASMVGVARGQDPHREHPRFNALNNQGMTALKEFYAATMAAKTAGTCGPPKVLSTI